MIFTMSSSGLISVFLSLLAVLVPPLATKVLAAPPVGATFEPPPGEGAPRGGTAGGASRPVRTACLPNSSVNSAALTAMAPRHGIGLSQSDRPNLFVYIPQTTAQTAEFSLFDEQMKGIYQVSVPVSQAGLVNIGLPDTAPSLVKEQTYYWTVALVCNPDDRTEDWVVGGWVEHVGKNDTFKQELEKVTAIERVSLYAQQGFWYDALNTLVELQRSQPYNPEVAATWTELMESVELDVISLTLSQAYTTQPVRD